MSQFINVKKNHICFSYIPDAYKLWTSCTVLYSDGRQAKKSGAGPCEPSRARAR